MEYQLVIQFEGENGLDFDTLIDLEHELTEALGDSADVDGHDMGKAESNIFVFTDDPRKTFARAQGVLDRKGLLSRSRAAYRDVSGDEFTILWPEHGSDEPFDVT